jgi:5-methylcytosine-specific restriction endonuclease McrA
MAKTFVDKVANVHGWNCHYCNGKTRKYPGNRYDSSHADEATVDHIVPRIKGGTDDTENTVIACRACNVRKKNLDRNVFGLKYFSDRLLSGEEERLSQ